MKLATIWTIPCMSIGERLSRTADLAAMTIAYRLPNRVKYWAFIHVGLAAIPSDAVVTDQLFVDVLERARR